MHPEPKALQCTQCGGKLIAQDGSDRAVCAYCGAESLLASQSQHASQIAQAVAAATASNERLAAEFALPRLRKELDELDRQLGTELTFKFGIPACIGLVVGILAIFAGASSKDGAFTIGFGVFAILAGLGATIVMMAKSSGMSRTEVRRNEIAMKIASAEATLNV